MKLKNKSNSLTSSLLAVLMVLFVSMGQINAEGMPADQTPVADVNFGWNSINFFPKVDHSAIQLTVDGPNGFVIQKTFKGGSAPFINLADNGAGFVDGQYNYELRIIPNVAVKLRNESEVAGMERPNVRFTGMKPLPMKQSGSFIVLNGRVVGPNSQPEPESTNAQTFTTDVIVDGSMCVGMDCVSSESFGSDTLRLKENNLRIHFDDTSASASFPKNDWRIVANDSTNGGSEYLAIEDSTAGTKVFKVDAGAGNNALVVDGDGQIGIGTATPVVNLHVVEGNTPTLRLEQDGSSGFTPQTWDIAGNETNFFIRDVTNSSKLPFRIKPGAPKNSLFIAADGDVGLGTETPDYTFEVETTGVGAMMVATRTDGATMEFSASGSYGIAGTRTDNPFRLRVNNKHILEINGSGNYLQVYDSAGTALGNYNGTWNDTSTRSMKENIADLTDDEAVSALDELQPVKYNYKHQKDEDRVGFIAEDVPDIVAQNGRKTISSMDIVGVLTKVVKKQQKELKDTRDTIKELKAEIEEIKKNK